MNDMILCQTCIWLKITLGLSLIN